MRLLARTAVMVVIGVTMAVVPGGGPAGASGGERSTASASASAFASRTYAELDAKVEAHIARYGGERLGRNQIVWEDRGETMTFPPPANARDGDTTLARLVCYIEDFCLYEHALTDRDGGAMLSMWRYGEHYLGASGWSNRASAWENNQTGHALGNVYEDCQGSWCFLFGGRAWAGQSYVGNARNDRADIVYLAA